MSFCQLSRPIACQHLLCTWHEHLFIIDTMMSVGSSVLTVYFEFNDSLERIWSQRTKRVTLCKMISKYTYNTSTERYVFYTASKEPFVFSWNKSLKCFHRDQYKSSNVRNIISRTLDLHPNLWKLNAISLMFICSNGGYCISYYEHHFVINIPCHCF